MTPGERLTTLIEYLGLNPNSFSTEIGEAKNTNTYHIIKGTHKSLSVKYANKVVAVFPQVNKTWLTGGKGEMIKPITIPQNINYEQLYYETLGRLKQANDIIDKLLNK